MRSPVLAASPKREADDLWAALDAASRFDATLRIERRLFGRMLRRYVAPIPYRRAALFHRMSAAEPCVVTGFAKPLRLVGVETIHGLLADHLNKELLASLPVIRRKGPESELMKRMLTILKNAEKRGEIKLEKIGPRIISLPLDLFRYEMLITQEPLTEETLTEIVDDIFMPLVRQ